MPVIKDLPNAVGGKTLKSTEPLSEVRQKVLILGSSFRKQREGKKITIYYSMHVFGGLGLKSNCQEGASALSDSRDSILEQRHAELWSVALILTLGSG